MNEMFERVEQAIYDEIARQVEEGDRRLAPGYRFIGRFDDGVEIAGAFDLQAVARAAVKAATGEE